MALQVKMKTEEIGADSSDSVTKVLRAMLRTGYGFANDVPEQVYIHCAIDQEKNSASFGVLFSIKGKIYTPQNINESDLTAEWDMSQKRLISLHQFLGNDLLNKIIPTLKAASKEIPDSIQASYDIESDKQAALFSYGVDGKLSKEQWEKEIYSTDEGIVVNMSDFDYLNIDEEF